MIDILIFAGCFLGFSFLMAALFTAVFKLPR